MTPTNIDMDNPSTGKFPMKSFMSTDIIYAECYEYGKFPMTSFIRNVMTMGNSQ